MKIIRKKDVQSSMVYLGFNVVWPRLAGRMRENQPTKSRCPDDVESI